MPVYYFEAEDSREIEGTCELPDDAAAIQFAKAIVDQMTAESPTGAHVSVRNESDETICDIVVEAATLH